MKKTLHVFHKPLDATNVRCSLSTQQKKENDILVLNVNLSCIRLPKDYPDDELLKSVIETGNFKTFDTFRKFVNYKFSKYEKIVVWHGDLASELLMLYMVCDLLPNDRLYEVDLNTIEELKPKIAETQKLHERLYETTLHYHYSMISASPNVVSEYNLLNRTTRISDERYQMYRDQWQYWKGNKTSFILNGPVGTLQSYPDNFMDKIIIERTDFNPTFLGLLFAVQSKLKKFGDIQFGISLRIRKLARDNGKLNMLFVRKKP